MENDFSGQSILLFTADIGGTHTRLSILSFNTELTILNKEVFPTKDWKDLSTLINSYLRKLGLKVENITAGCLSLAGPIRENSCLLTNSHRIIDFATLNSSLPFQFPLLFVNDLEAMGRGIALLKSDDLLPLIHFSAEPSLSTSVNPSLSTSVNPSLSTSVNPSLCTSVNPSLNTSFNTSLSHSAEHFSPSPSENQGHKSLLAPGTGLGEAMITATGEVYTSEGGHGDFAPRREKEVDLWRFLTARYGHVSYERVLSGAGLENIYEFLSLKANSQKSPQEKLTAPDITERALAGICPLCMETLEVFVSILGAEAGNLALRTLARGGVYLGGGIPKKIIPFLQGDSFWKSFRDKGPMQDFLTQIPIYIILNENTPLLGAAQIALDSYLGPMPLK